jgi:hypothetical protein
MFQTRNAAGDEPPDAWLMASERLASGRPANALCGGAPLALDSGVNDVTCGLRTIDSSSSSTKGAGRLLL